MKNTNLLSAVSALALGAGAALAVSPLFHRHADPAALAHPMWAHPYATLEQMAADADAVVVGRVIDEWPGRVVPTSGGRFALPFTIAGLEVEELVLGQAEGTLAIERTGGQLGDGALLALDDGGPFTAGSRVLLFLKAQPDTGFWIVSHPKGRFDVDGAGAAAVLHAALPGDEVAQQLDGVRLDDALARLRGLR